MFVRSVTGSVEISQGQKKTKVKYNPSFITIFLNIYSVSFFSVLIKMPSWPRHTHDNMRIGGGKERKGTGRRQTGFTARLPFENEANEMHFPSDGFHCRILCSFPRKWDKFLLYKSSWFPLAVTLSSSAELLAVHCILWRRVIATSFTRYQIFLIIGL